MTSSLVARIRALFPESRPKGRTIFYFTGSASSWVSQGESRTINPAADDEYTVKPQILRGGELEISIDSKVFGDPNWMLCFVAPGGRNLEVGDYAYATRFPFQNANDPGFSFSGNGRGCNSLCAAFRILEIKVKKGKLQSFAADFAQYDEKHDLAWNFGCIRYHSEVSLSMERSRDSRMLFYLVRRPVAAMAAN